MRPGTAASRRCAGASGRANRPTRPVNEPETAPASPDASPTGDDAAKPAVAHVNLPVDVRSASLAVIAVLAVILALKWAELVLVPIALAAFLSYMLRPLVVGLRRHAHIPEALGAAIALILALGLIVAGTAALAPQATRLLDSVPQATRSLEQVLKRTSLDKTSAVQKLLRAADGLERVATSGPMPETEPLRLRGYLWSGTEALVSGLFQTIVVLALCYFLLLSSQSFKRKLVRISGVTISQKKNTVRILDEIDSQIQRYVIIQVATSALMGAATGLAFALIGLQNAMFWGVAAGVLHLVPYVGTAVVVLAATVFAWVQFASVDGVLLVSSSALVIAGLIGFGLVPWLTQKIGRINSVATLVSLIVWQWLWGIPGLLLGIPIMMSLIAVCERVDKFQPIAELLSSDAPPPLA